MHDFGAFCYMDVEKTGSSFVKNVLKEVSILPIISSRKHATIEHPPSENLSYQKFYQNIPVIFLRFPNLRKKYSEKWGGRFRDNCFYFNSVRDPFDYYVSLYNYGCDGKGGLAIRLNHCGCGHLYDRSEGSFLRWIDFILDRNNARYMSEDYANTCSAIVGFLTYRFLRLSFMEPKLKLESISAMSDVQDKFEAYNICQYTVKNESLNDDLLYLFRGKLKPYVKKDAASHLRTRQKVNASFSKSASKDMLRKSSVADLILERESFIFEKFYPQLMC